jgi:hypothetical protein
MARMLIMDKNKMKKLIKVCLLKTLPVMAGYMVLGIGFGIISAKTMDDIVSVDSYYSDIKDALIENIERYIDNSHPNQKEYNKSLYNKIKELFGIN